MDAAEFGSMMDKYSAFGAVACAISLAKDVGILDILHKTEEALTSEQIAEKGGLKVRYVKELMGALVTGRVVQVDSSSTRFHISPEFKPVLKEKSLSIRHVPNFGVRYNAIKSCFRKDGPAGVRYDEYPGIFDIMDALREAGQDKLLGQDVLPACPEVVEKLGSGIDVLEIGTANGILLLNLCKRFPSSRFTGSDVVESVLDIARMRADDRGITNCNFTILDVCSIPESPVKQYDWIFVRDVIHDLPKPHEALSGLKRMLKPGGICTIVDMGIEGTLAENVGNMSITWLYVLGTFLCIPESYQGGDSAALGPCWGVELARKMIADAGFKLINEQPSESNKTRVTFVCQRPL